MTESPSSTKPRPSVGPLPVAEPMPMTPGRRVALALGVPVALVLIGSAGLSAVGLTGPGGLLGGPRKTYQSTLPAVPVRAGAVTMKIGAGDAQFSPGPPGDDHGAPVTGTARYQGRRPTFTEHTTTAGTSLLSSCTGRPRCSVSYAVAMPAGVALRAAVTSGDLTVRQLTSAVSLQVGTGDISGSALAGPVRITDQSGDITLGALSGPVQISDRSGDVALRSVSGGVAVHISSQSGDVTLGSVSGLLQVSSQLGDVSFGPVTGPSVTVRSQSGDVTGQGISTADVTVTGGSGDIALSFSQVPTRVQVICGSGDVTLHLPHGRTAYRVITKDSNGSVSLNVPTDASSPNVITVTDGTGDISIGS